MYTPLWTLGADAQISQLPGLQGSPDFSDLIDRQIREHAEEQAIQKQVRSFGMSAEVVTEAVRQQYEESPYPRWLDVTLPDPVRFSDAMAQRFPFLAPIEIDSPVSILVAGCGTGYHPIKVAAHYSDAAVLAVDISRASLAYGIRKARAYGIKNLEFLHGDLLRVEELGRKFDVVEAVGVLHHLADPAAGFRALSNVLAPGGLMKIGIYSRRARLRFEAAKRLIEGCGSCSPNQLRLLRQEVVAHAGDDAKAAMACWDFFYLSGFRDLLCHVHEVQFTPAELKTVLKNLNVSFLGYCRVNAEMSRAYRERFPQDPKMRDLDLVDQFEADHPDVFWSLQTFWVRGNLGSQEFEA
jgi:SAM-dependent methyltransferase